MFVGYYTDRLHQEIHFLETSMIGDVNLDDFFPEEKLDSTMAGKSQESVSKFMFEKSKEYATRIYNEHKDLIHSGKVNYMFLEIDKATRAYVQPIGHPRVCAAHCGQIRPQFHETDLSLS